jgi:dienelactone hydrolase
MQSSSPPASSPVEERARTFVDELAKGEWDQARTSFDETMASALPPAKLEALFWALESDSGSFRQVEATRVVHKDAFRIVLVTCRFERLRKVLRVVFDREDKVAGFFYGPVPEEIEAKTRSLIAAAASGDFDLASRDFGDVMKEKLPPPKLGETWNALQQKVGKWRAVENVELKPEQGVWVSVATSQFERGRLLVKVVYDSRDQIVGLFFLPPPVAWSAPPYAKPNAFDETPVTVGVAPPLPGVLTVPRGDGPFPAVVLVHGSGPQDEDETVGAVKVFKDLAWGLGSRGVAVLRYHKRSLVSAAGMLTQKEEVLDGAHDALELVARSAQIDRHKVFLLGHSQGGHLAPRIAKDNPSLAGLILFAASSRPLQDVLIEQYTYLSSLEPANTALAAQTEAARVLQRVVADPALRPDQDVALPAGGSLKGAYFLDARDYDPEAVAQGLSCRVLVLQGERDYQVTTKDFDRWKRALEHRGGVRLKIYPSLNHQFVTGTGAPSPLEYERGGHVDEGVVNDIAAWIAEKTP